MKMRPAFENGAPVPAFLNKLWKMVDDQRTNNLISWGPDGKSFIIKHQGEFCAELLPLFYKHSNMASFVRQLNMYGFHKVSNIEGSGIRSDREEIEFVHPCFQRDEPKLIEHIKRKMSSRMSQANNNRENQSIEIMSKVLDDVEQMRGKQLSLDAQLAQMKQHNVALWRELSLLRRKHHKQQQIVNKLIQFLVSFVQPSRTNLNGVGIKRRFPLMINDTQENDAKTARIDSSGPTIHELDPTEGLLEEPDFLEPVIEIYSPEMSGQNAANSSIAESMKSSSSSLEYDDNEECPLSPDLMFATSPHLVTPSSVMETEADQPESVKTPEKREAARKSRKQSNQVIEVVDVPEPLVSSPASILGEEGTDPLLLTSDSDIFQAAAGLLGMEVEASEALTNLVSGANPTLSSATDLTTLLNDISPSTEEKTNENSSALTTVDSNKTLLPSGSYGVKGSRVFRKEDNDLTNSASGVPSPASTSKMTVATVSPDNITSLSSANVCFSEDLDSHLECMQNDLDSLKDLLSNEGYSLDANTLLGLFGTEDPMSYTLPLASNDNAMIDGVRSDPSNDTDLAGSELIAYPSSFDLEMFCPSDEIDTPDNSLDAIDSSALLTPKVKNEYNS